jgi:hypothetical protein
MRVSQPSTISSPKRKKTSLTILLSGQEEHNMQKKCTSPGNRCFSTLPLQTTSPSPSASGTTNSSTSTKPDKANSGEASSTETTLATWQKSNDNFSFTRDNNDLEETLYPTECYYYDGDTHPLLSPEPSYRNNKASPPPSKQTPVTPDFLLNPLSSQNENENKEINLQNKIKKKPQKIKKKKQKKKKEKKKHKKTAQQIKNHPEKPSTIISVHSATQESMTAHHRLHQSYRPGPTKVLQKHNLECTVITSTDSEMKLNWNIYRD